MIHAKHNLYETALKDESVLLAPDEQSIPEQVKNLEQKYIDRRLEPVIIRIAKTYVSQYFTFSYDFPFFL